MPNIKEQLDRIKTRISDADFLANKGLSNEVGIHVFCYSPSDELVVRDYTRRLVAEADESFRVIECDLYRIFLEILQDEGVTDDIPAFESDEGSEALLEQMHNIASPQDFLKKMQYSPHERGDVLFLTGVGSVYPFMRAHNMLDSMQQAFSDIPIVVFYPGEYNGQSLSLFGKFFDGNYYRAFNLL
jgi:hypothetical protein